MDTEAMDLVLTKIAELKNRVSELENDLNAEQVRREESDDRLERLLNDEQRNREYEATNLERKIESVERSARNRY